MPSPPSNSFLLPVAINNLLLYGILLLTISAASSSPSLATGGKGEKHSAAHPSPTEQIYLDVGRCDPRQFTKKPHPASNNSYLHCNADGTLAQRDCPQGKFFDRKVLECRRQETTNGYAQEKPHMDPEAAALLKEPQFQAPDDICPGGVPLTRLSAPVVCNPTAVSSCPDSFSCMLHARTGAFYCCSNMFIEPVQELSTLCTGNQVTYFDPMTGIPKSCVLGSGLSVSGFGSSSTCPTGFGCNRVAGSFYRCCGRDFGCPANSAGYINPLNGAYVQCSVDDSSRSSVCPQGFVCRPSAMFNSGVCCSDTAGSGPGGADAGSCGAGGENPLSRPNPCSASAPCPNGYSCRNGRCCQARGLCPAGTPLGGVTSCSSSNPCPNNYQCVTSNGQQYCCPAPEHVCGQARDAGLPCDSRVQAVSRYYFDAATGSCRAFQYSQCGGNANNFDTLDQCEGFCLEAQCPQGMGLRAGPSIASCSAAQALGDAVSPRSGGADATCPSHYSCVQPLYGANFVCCTGPETVCRDPVTSGSPCFGTSLTIQRYHYNFERGQCEPFQYYGCSGSGNNFITRQQCEQACQPTVKNACNGVAPMNDEGGSDYVQRCSENVPCPLGGWCNSRGYCCPYTETACLAPKSIGHTCLSQKPGTYWYYDPNDNSGGGGGSCLPFTYSGCGGTPNRFVDRESCEQMCVSRLGDCPRGMAPFLTRGGAKRCTLNMATSCPDGSSCVRSSLGEPICCSSTAQCPVGRSAYIIPGSDSKVTCLPDASGDAVGAVENCPQGFVCLESSNVSGFFMCCSAASSRRTSPTYSRLSLPSGGAAGGPPSPDYSNIYSASFLAAISPNGLAAANRRYAAAAMKTCPGGLLTNGERCTLNEIEGCSAGYVCLPEISGGGGGAGGSVGGGIRGLCCKATPKCLRKRRPYYIGKRQAVTCGDHDEAGCPRGSSCSSSNIEGVDICCLPPSKGIASSSAAAAGGEVEYRGGVGSSQVGTPFSSSKVLVPKVVPKCRDGSLPYFALGSRVAQSCAADHRGDECPEEYECEMASDEQFYCCPAWDRCPPHSSPFLVEGSRKPLGCNWMANNCPEGYSCEGSKDRAICCRARPSAAQCPTGRSPYLYAKRPLVCPPQLQAGKRSCPAGYDCVASTHALQGGSSSGSSSVTTSNLHICCSSLEHHVPECVNGFAFLDPATSRNQVCDPSLDACPPGYRCKRSTMANAHVCCTIAMDNRYEGYCPPGQVPYTGVGGIESSPPPTCHMALNPCPAGGAVPYQCTYSPEKQDSYCCAPVDAAAIAARYSQYYRNYASKAAATTAGGFTPQQLQLMAAQQQQYQQQHQQYNQQQQGYMPNAQDLAALAGLQQALSQPSNQGGQQQQQEVAGCGGETLLLTYPPSTASDQQHQSQQQYNLPQVSSAVAQHIPTSVVGNPSKTSPPSEPSLREASEGTATNTIFVASCPPWSKPLLNVHTKLGHPCSTWNRCPDGFTCYSNFPDGRNAHCCTTVPLDNQVVFRANQAPTAAATTAAADQLVSSQSPNFMHSPPRSTSASFDQPIALLLANPIPTDNGLLANYSLPPSNNVNNSSLISTSTSLVTVVPAPMGGQCPTGMVNIDGSCKRMFFVGQQGCESDAQCVERTNGTRCVNHYCQCEEGRLVHDARCVAQCPEGTVNIASRCHDITSIVFMDSVDERDNGTIGGYCLGGPHSLAAAAEQCAVENAYCSERSVTCQCRPGYQLHMEGGFGNRSERGECRPVEGSKFGGSTGGNEGEERGEKSTKSASQLADYGVPAALPGDPQTHFYVIDGADGLAAAETEAGKSDPLVQQKQNGNYSSSDPISAPGLNEKSSKATGGDEGGVHSLLPPLSKSSVGSGGERTTAAIITLVHSSSSSSSSSLPSRTMLSSLSSSLSPSSPSSARKQSNKPLKETAAVKSTKMGKDESSPPSSSSSSSDLSQSSSDDSSASTFSPASKISQHKSNNKNKIPDGGRKEGQATTGTGDRPQLFHDEGLASPSVLFQSDE